MTGALYQNGGKGKADAIPAEFNLTHGPLAHLLKNRTYLGKTHHSGEWFAGEHEPIIDQETFQQVQELIKANSVTRRQKRSENGALLTGLLYDDRGNRMTPSFTTKRDVRYRFYVSTALLNGRKQEAGTLPRISGPDLEAKIIDALKDQKAELSLQDFWTDRDIVDNRVDRIEVSRTNIRITLKTRNDVLTSIYNPSGPDLDANDQLYASRHIDIRWQQNSKGPLAQIEEATTRSGHEPDPALVQAIARAHSWTKSLIDGEHTSIESLAASINMHPKVVRKGLRLAFLAPEITEAIFLGYQPKALTLTELQQTTSLSWLEQRGKWGVGERAIAKSSFSRRHELCVNFLNINCLLRVGAA